MTTPIDRNKECWTAFCPDDQVAEKELKRITEKLAEKKLIVSAKKELISNRDHRYNGLIPYKFTIITAPRPTTEPN